ncbi:MAG TPA: hypothetical protein VH062_28975 [Polyangiaceae bacterium]|jgi:hypothetical protein|nr:hypothetical protein [Polyangiaceae bacterium]
MTTTVSDAGTPPAAHDAGAPPAAQVDAGPPPPANPTGDCALPKTPAGDDVEVPDCQNPLSRAYWHVKWQASEGAAYIIPAGGCGSIQRVCAKCAVSNGCTDTTSLGACAGGCIPNEAFCPF